MFESFEEGQEIFPIWDRFKRFIGVQMTHLQSKMVEKGLNADSRIVDVVSWELPSLSWEADCGVLEKMLQTHPVVLVYKSDENGEPTALYQCKREELVRFLIEKTKTK